MVKMLEEEKQKLFTDIDSEYSFTSSSDYL